MELLETEPDIAAPATPEPLPVPARGAIRFEGVEFNYPSRPDHAALAGFDLEVRSGEKLAIVGPSGAGKTTVFQLLLRFYDPGAGGADAVDGPGHSVSRLRDQPEAVAAQTVHVRINHRDGRRRRHHGLDGVAAFAKTPQTCFGCQVMRGSHHAAGRS